MDISKEYIENALDFYKITDTSYRRRCIEDSQRTLDNEKLYIRFKNVFDTLYFGHDEERYAVRAKTKEELFGSDSPEAMTSITVLAGVGIHKSGMEKYRFDAKQVSRHRERVCGVLCDDIKMRGTGYIRPSQMQWGTNFSLIKLIEVGRLQFERTLDSSDTVNVHIPAGAPLTLASVCDSIKRALVLLEEYFGIKSPRFVCKSWLLSAEVADIIPDSSNISVFRRMFDVTPSKDSATDDLLDYIWNRDSCDSFSALEENTSLQRAVKKSLMSGTKFYEGYGVLRNGGIF